MTEEEKTVEGLDNIVAELKTRADKAEESAKDFVSNFQKFTGFQPGEQMTAFKVLQMIRNIEGHAKND